MALAPTYPDSARHKSAEEFRLLVIRYGSLIRRIAAAYEADPDLREDLVQTVLVAVWRALPNFRAEASLKTFIARIAQRQAMTFVARQMSLRNSRQLSDDLVDGRPLPDEVAIANNLRERLLFCVRGLPLPQREVVSLLLEDFSYAEIAQTIGISVNAAVLRGQRAKFTLAAAMGDEFVNG